MTTVYYGAAVYVNADNIAEAFVVADDKFAFVGSTADALALPHDREVDLGGAFVTPGFVDSHMHLLGYGNALNQPHLNEHTSSLRDMVDCMRGFLADHPRGRDEWLVGRGWNQDYFADAARMPDRRDLDRVSTDIPVCAVRACGHCLAVNTRALDMLGITRDTPEVEGGRIGRDVSGEPNGLFFDGAMSLVYAAIPPVDKSAVKDMIRAACRSLGAYGVTGVQTDDYCLNRAIDWRTINDAYRELERDGELTVRVYEQANFTDLDSYAEFIAEGNVTGAGSEFFRMGPLKMLGDGALGARTAYLSRPYFDDPSTCGIPVFSQQTLDDMIDYANAHGCQVAVHAIGDSCLDMVLDAIDRALTNHPRIDHRHGVVHCQVSRPEQLRRIAELGLHVYYQGIFIDYDSHILTDRVGDELAATSYNWKSLADMGVCCSNGTDCPVELPDPLASMQCAVTRRSLDGSAEINPSQAFTVSEAIDGYTIRSAEASFEQDVKGRIRAGMLADFVVLGANLTAIDPMTIHSTPVLATYVGGRCVYKKED